MPEALFEITCTSPLGRATAYALDADGAYCAFWTLRREADIQGAVPMRIENLATGQVVFNGEV